MSDIELKPPPPPGSSTAPSESVEPKLFKLYVGEWARSQKKTNDKIQSLEDINKKLNLLNSALAKLGKLQAQVGESGDAKKLVEALNKDPGLIYQINQDIKQAELPEPAFRNSEGSVSEKWDTHNPRVYDPNFELTLRVRVLKDLGERDWPAIQWWFNNKLNLQPSQMQNVTDSQWKDLANQMLSPVPAGQTQLIVPSPLPADNTIGSLGWAWYSAAELNRDFALRFNEAHASRVSGGLTTSHTGADLYGAVQIVKSEITNLSNRLQSATTAVNQSMQVTTAIMSAITDVTQKIFDAKSKALN
jgi:hypothetical protein